MFSNGTSQIKNFEKVRRIAVLRGKSQFSGMRVEALRSKGSLLVSPSVPREPKESVCP